jgi:hypothetical protein
MSEAMFAFGTWMWLVWSAIWGVIGIFWTAYKIGKNYEHSKKYGG